MDDLTESETQELAKEIQEFTQNMALVGLVCVVVIAGRGITRLAYPAHVAPYIPGVLSNALDTARGYNARQAN